jgi:hypothetical protein
MHIEKMFMVFQISHSLSVTPVLLTTILYHITPFIFILWILTGLQNPRGPWQPLKYRIFR